MAGQPLIGREEELAQLRDRLGAAQGGAGGAVVLRGEAGVGKTALLDALAACAAGMLVLRATGVEAESELAFAMLSALLRPVLDGLDALPEIQADALRAAFGIGPGKAVGPFATFAAVLALLAQAAVRRPVLCLVDDAHWVDEASARALLFAARRVSADPVLLVFAARTREEVSFEAAGVPELGVGRLGDAAARALLDRRFGSLSADVREQLLTAATGNPLALLELPAALSEGQRSGEEALPDPVPASARIDAAFAARLQRLSDEERLALLVAAADEQHDAALVGDALVELGLERGLLSCERLAPLVAVVGRDVRFRHPLVRSLAYHRAPASGRRAAHAALARALPADAVERRAWHLAASVDGVDEDVAGLLVEAAARARRRGGVLAAGRALERASDLTADGELRVARLLDASQALVSAGRRVRAGELVARARDLAQDERSLLDADLVRARLLFGGGEEVKGRDLAVDVARRAEAIDPERAGRAWLFAADVRWAGLDVPGASAAYDRAWQLTDRAGPRAAEVAAAVAGAHARVGSGSVAEALVTAAGERGLVAAEALAELDRGEEARPALQARVDAARREGMLDELVDALFELSWVELRAARIAEAVAYATEGAQVADDIDSPRGNATPRVVLATIAALRGDEAGCAAQIERLRQRAGAGRRTFLELQIPGFLGLLELSLGRPESAVEPLSLAVRHPRRRSHHADWPELVEALALAGREAEAQTALARFAELNATRRRAGGQAVEARLRGLLALDGRFDEPFAEALSRHPPELPLERARTALLYGRRLRRAGRRRDARTRLREALATYEACDVPAWAEQARRELRATGEHARRREPSTLDELTAQELQVALLACDGATNAEAAATLFVTVKTIERHLSSAYRKLGVRSRVELARRLPGVG